MKFDYSTASHHKCKQRLGCCFHRDDFKWFSPSGNLTKSPAAEENHQRKFCNIWQLPTNQWETNKKKNFHFLFLFNKGNTITLSCLKEYTDFAGHSVCNSKLNNTRLLHSYIKRAVGIQPGSTAHAILEWHLARNKDCCIFPWLSGYGPKRKLSTSRVISWERMQMGFYSLVCF